MIYLASGIIFISVFALVLLLNQAVTVRQLSVRTRLNAIRDMEDSGQEDILNLPFKARVLVPLQEKAVNFFSRFLPANLKDTTERRLVQAGNPRGIKANSYLAGVIVLAASLTVLGFMVTLVTGAGVLKALGTAVCGMALGVLVPVLWLNMTAEKRVKEIDRALPDALDLLVVSVEAGLAFDMAMAKVTERFKGPLGEEFARALNEMKMGKNRQAALRDLSKRVGSDNLHSFLSMIIQATVMGFAIAPVLRIQAETMRRVRRQRAEEQAMKAPVKMVFPLVFCIFPALFIVILGPALIQIMRAL